MSLQTMIEAAHKYRTALAAVEQVDVALKQHDQRGSDLSNQYHRTSENLTAARVDLERAAKNLDPSVVVLEVGRI